MCVCVSVCACVRACVRVSKCKANVVFMLDFRFLQDIRLSDSGIRSLKTCQVDGTRQTLTKWDGAVNPFLGQADSD